MRALLIGALVATASACAAGLADEHERASSSTGPERNDAGAVHVTRFTPARIPTAQITRPMLVDSGAGGSSTDDAGPDDDAGADPANVALERAYVTDCTETVMCSGPANNIPQCVASVRQALSMASPATRQVFLENVRRCQQQHACDYVDCVQQKAP